MIWIEAAIGIATSAPSTPSSVAPNSTETSTTKPFTFTVRFWTWGWIRLFSICWYTIAHTVHRIVSVGKSPKRVTMPISTAAIVAPTSGTSENRPAITASGAANGAPMIVSTMKVDVPAITAITSAPVT